MFCPSLDISFNLHVGIFLDKIYLVFHLCLLGTCPHSVSSHLTEDGQATSCRKMPPDSQLTWCEECAVSSVTLRTTAFVTRASVTVAKAPGV